MVQLIRRDELSTLSTRLSLPGRYRDTASFVLLAVLFGGSFVGIKTGLRELPPLLFASLRFDIAAAALVGYVVAANAGSTWLPPTRSDLLAALAGEEDERQLGVLLADRPQYLEPVHPGHVVIGDETVRRPVPEYPQAFLETGCCLDGIGVVFPLQVLPCQLRDMWVVVDTENTNIVVGH